MFKLLSRLSNLTVLIVLADVTAANAAWWQADATARQPQPRTLETVLSAGWTTKSGAYELATDATIGRKVLTTKAGVPLVLSSKAFNSGSHELRALVRLRTDVQASAGATFSMAGRSVNDPGVRVRLTASRDNDLIQCIVDRGDSRPLHDVEALAAKLPWAPQVASTLDYQLKAYTRILPGWPQEFRRLIEHDMTRLPGHDAKWLEVRVELGKGRLRVYLDDRLVTTRDAPEFDAVDFTQVELSPGVQLADFNITLTNAARNTDFVPLKLDGYANALAFLNGEPVAAASLPRAGQKVRVRDIPFVFSSVNPEGNDHIDVGQSLLRQANASGYIPTNEYRWAGSRLRDPARIQLRIANGQYDSLYLIAASDGGTSSIPVVTAQFYRPNSGFPASFSTRVPMATATPKGAQPLGVTLSNGRKVSLWLVKMALNPAALTAFADLDIVEMELTKAIHLYRSYPDPISYDYHQGGRPSGVHVYAATLGRVPVGFEFNPDKFGHVWTAPAVPGYTATLTNHTGAPQRAVVTVTTRSYDGSETSKQEKAVMLAAGKNQKVKLSVPVKLNGYHDITGTVQIGGRTWTEKRSLARLAPDTRAVRWTEGQGVLFGYWSYHGGHHSPRGDLTRTVMAAAGARASLTGAIPGPDEPARKHWARMPSGAWSVSAQPWAAQVPLDPEKVAAYKKEVVAAYEREWGKTPEDLRPDFVAFFPEPHISTRLTGSSPPSHWGEPDFEWTPEEKERIRMFRVTAEIAASAVKERWPHLKVLVPWGDPLFPIPLLRDGISKQAVDGSGIDVPGFERLPEMQVHQITTNRVLLLRKEFEKAGIPNPALYYIEGIFVPTLPGAVSWREQMDIYNRWNLLAMAQGITRFYSGWSAFDLASYYGAEHYGGMGIQRRVPYMDPKPAYAAYATMTDKLDRANFDGWMPTGSLSTYCLRFKGPKGFVYALWTLRGKRPVTLAMRDIRQAQVTDAMNNVLPGRGSTTDASGTLTVETGPSVIYITGAEATKVSVGRPDNSDAVPSTRAVQVADLGDGAWKYTGQRDVRYEEGNFGISRYLGRFSSAVVADPIRGRVLRSRLEKQDKVHELMPWYNTLTPAKPVTLNGAPSHLGLWVKGNSDWGRVVYNLRDAKGEKWISVGAKDDYNNDDIHAWSHFNFDGWRYLRFEMPGHLPYDLFRKHGTTWWGSQGGDGVVDLPLRLDNIIVEQRSHVLYVNDVQPAPSNTVEFGKVYVEYAAPEEAGAEAVRLSRLRMPLPAQQADLPNPIRQMEASGVGAPTQITRIVPPEHAYDGTRAHVFFNEVPGAQNHFVWVSAHSDGRGAVNLTPGGARSGVLVYGLRPGIPLYYWVVYQDAQGKLSKPSPTRAETLVDAFAQK